MHVISTIIQTLTEEEKRSFLNLLRQKNKRTDTKNIELFKLLNTTTEIKDADILIYGKKSKGAFHALCKRLHDSLIDFIASKSFESETSEEMDILKLLLASRIFFEHKQPIIALKTINKAEHKAKAYDLYSILQEIYYTKVQYAHYNKKQSLQELIINLQYNRKLLQQEENLNLLYATIRHTPPKNTKDLSTFLKKTLEQFDISITQGLTFRSLFKILGSLNKTAHIQRKHLEILPFVEYIYQQINTKESLAEKHLFYHIQILYFVSNVYFRSKNFKTSKHYLNLMREQMKKQEGKHYKTFYPQYILLNTLNNNYTGNSIEAIKLLETFDYKKHKDQITYILDLKLSLIVFYFQQNEFNKAYTIFKEFYHSDIWYTQKTGIIWVLKKSLIEILLLIELEHVDLVSSRLESFRKKHLLYLKKHSETKIIEFLKLVSSFHKDPEVVNSKSYQTTVKHSLMNIQPKEEDIFEISFYAWLKAKTDKVNLYETTLQLIKS